MKKQKKAINPYVPYIALCIIALGGFILFRYTGLIWAEESREANPKIPVLCPRCSLDFIRDLLKEKNLNNSYMPDTSFGSESTGIADLRGTDFNNAFLDNAQFYANLTNASFKNASLVGATINVSAAPSAKVNFRGANLMEISLSGNFPDANFTKANLTRANLSETKDMSSANVTEVVWSNTTCPDGSNSDSHDNTCVGHF